MGFKKVFVQSPAHLSLSLNSLQISCSGNKTRIPIEDIEILIIENRQTTFSVAAIEEVAQSGTIILCDDRHLPSTYVLNSQRHSRQLQRIQLQQGISRPLQKQIWQMIVKQKILNQASNLVINGKRSGYEYLTDLSKRVSSGDGDNTEAVAARAYFSELFGASFNRGQDVFINACLNYGYAIVRAYIARQISGIGFLPSIGINHKSQLNEFNLADDLIEPFRPFVDLVCTKLSSKDESLSSEHKKELISVLDREALIGDRIVKLSTAIDVFVSSFLRAVQNNDSSELIFPELKVI